MKATRPKKRNLDTEHIKRYLKSISFQTQTTFQPWRHFVAMGTFEGKSAVFKLAST